MFPTIDIENLTVNKRKDQNGALYVSYSYGEFNCIARELGSPIGRQVASAQGLSKDIEIVIDSLGYAMHIEDSEEFNYGEEYASTPPTQSIKRRIISSLFISAIVTYCKGFSESKARNLQIQDPELKRIFSEEQFLLHKKIKFWRNS